MPNATLCTFTARFQESIQYGLERKVTSLYVRYWYSFYIHPMDSVFNVFSSSHRFTQGLPQGSVLAPLLFLFYINNLSFSHKDGAVVALFADNVSILNTARKKEGAEFTAQSVINSVLIGSQEWKLNLNADKSEVYPFLTWSNNNPWEPAFFIGTQKILFNVTPYLLGVILDKSLTFNAHLKKVTTSLSSSLCTIRAIAHTSWGRHRSTLKIAFHALIRSIFDYAAPAWQPWLSATNLSCLDCLQNRSLRLITGQLVSAALEALSLNNADIKSYHTCSNRCWKLEKKHCTAPAIAQKVLL